MSSSSSIRVLDPTVCGAGAKLSPPERLASLRGRVLGIRVDRTWTSFQRVAARFAETARRRLAVREVVLFDPGVRIGTTEEERRKVAGFVRAVDAAIVGLGT